MKFDRIMKTAVIGFWLAAVGACGVLPWLHLTDWTHPGHLALWLVLMAVAVTCGVFFLVAAWPFKVTEAPPQISRGVAVWQILMMSVFPLSLIPWWLGWISMNTVALASLTMSAMSLALSWRRGHAR
jgi:hypothetical protein